MTRPLYLRSILSTAISQVLQQPKVREELSIAGAENVDKMAEKNARGLY